jgi:hypothetical protein
MTLDYLHIERPIVRLVNEHKKELGFQLLKMDSDLAGVAGRHSTSMIVGDYFGHTDLSGFDIAERYRLEKITCSSKVSNGSAETIYRNTGPVLKMAEVEIAGMVFDRLSRPVVENPVTGRIGVGISVDDRGGLYATANMCLALSGKIIRYRFH